MCRKEIKICAFLIILFILLGEFQRVFSFKYTDGIYTWNTFYELKEKSIDVLCLGSSHIFENVNTGILWEEYGIASYDLCGSMQPLWNSYYFMKEALKTQEPEVIVLDVYGAVQKDEYMDSSRIIKNNYGIKISEDKIESIKTSAPKDTWIDYFLEYPTYHSRYEDINESDFREHLGLANFQYWKGYGLNTAITPMKKPEDIANVKSVGEISEKTEKYLRKIIDLSKEKKIPLCLISTPYILSMEDQKIYNRVAQIAEQQNVPFINFNLLYDEIGLDFDLDFADTSHLNHNGNPKFSRYLADYLKNHYKISDRRGNAEYGSYEIMAKDCRQNIYNQELKEIQDIGTYLNKMQNENYIIIYSISGNYKDMKNYDAVKNELIKYNVNLDSAQGDAVWVIQNQEIIFESGSSPTFQWYKDVGNDDVLTVKSSQTENMFADILLNDKQYLAVNSGLNIMIYDTFLEKMVEASGFYISGNQLYYGKQIAQ